MRLLKILIPMLCIAAAPAAHAQAMYRDSARVPETEIQANVISNDSINSIDSVAILQPDTKTLMPADTTVSMRNLPCQLFGPMTFVSYEYLDSADMWHKDLSGNAAFRWFEEEAATHTRAQRIAQTFMVKHPQYVPYNIAFLPEPPRKYTMSVDPKDHTIHIDEVTPELPGHIDVYVKKRHWIRTFASSLQFSQAYVSPNWYQGGNNNLNTLINVQYDVKLNPKYHPNLLFVSILRYKLGLNSAPDDDLRNYSISEDLLQFNSTLGIKAASRWYYSLTAQFKTQIFKSYVTNTYDLKAAFLSPADLTAGLGMTYNYTNKRKTFNLDISIAPLSYNLKVCTDATIDHTKFGINADKDTKMSIGSSSELKLAWKICSNITFTSRMFTFTDYGTFYADWENTLGMDINRYLSTQIYVHARYDTNTPRSDDHPDWHKLQVKEILSFGLAYKFSSI